MRRSFEELQRCYNRREVRRISDADGEGYIYAFVDDNVWKVGMSKDFIRRQEEWDRNCPDLRRIWLPPIRVANRQRAESLAHLLLEMACIDRPRAYCQICQRKHIEHFIFSGTWPVVWRIGERSLNQSYYGLLSHEALLKLFSSSPQALLKLPSSSSQALLKLSSSSPPALPVDSILQNPRTSKIQENSKMTMNQTALTTFPSSRCAPSFLTTTTPSVSGAPVQSSLHWIYFRNVPRLTVREFM
ncbi:MAG: hypothetical protein NXY57DRAFT_1044494 [Lentinula lateritia]|nr:MAG: hypothetical protein NXY57DRAFT_1044494 [Lentinula lateritia]